MGDTRDSWADIEMDDNVTYITPQMMETNFTVYMSMNDTSHIHDIIENEAVQSVFSILYISIFGLGIFGNVLVCYVVARNRAMQTVTNFFITNLALSDILVCALAVPFTPLYSFSGQWVFGSVLCHLFPYAQGVSVYVSTFTLTSIAVDRFFVIIYPFHPRMKTSVCAAIVCVIWAFSLLATLPYGMYMRLTPSPAGDSYYCEEMWPSKTFRQIFGVFTVVMQFALPFCVIAFCYIKVSLKLNDRARCKPGAKTTRREEADRERKRRTNRMLIAMVAIFGVSWLPLNLINIVNDMHEETGHWRFYHLCFFMGHVVAMSSTCYNPFLYAWLNENFRKEFKQVLPCFAAAGAAQRASAATASTRASGWRAERPAPACNGNGNGNDGDGDGDDTLQETLLGGAGGDGCRARREDGVDVEAVRLQLAGASAAAYEASREPPHISIAL